MPDAVRRQCSTYVIEQTASLAENRAKSGTLVRRSRTPLEDWIMPIMPIRYVCDKCGYLGFLAIEEEPKHELKED